VTAAAALPLPVAGSGRERLELLSALIGAPGFDPLLRGDIIEFPRDHPVYWWGCRIPGCERPRRENKMLCAGHEAQCREACLAGADRVSWMRDAAPLARTYARVPEPCRICMHRPAIRGASRLCARHRQRWKKARRKAGTPGFGEWLAAQVPYDSYGGCRVAVCPELACSPLGLCHGHESAYHFQGSPGGARLPNVWFGRFEQAGQAVPVCYDDETGFSRWCRAALPLPRPGTVNLRGLAPLARAEIQWGLHAHAQAAEHAGWSLGWVQAIADACRGLDCLADLDTSPLDHTVRNAVAEMLAALRLVYLTPAETREAGYLEFGHFGAESGSRRGRFDLTAIRQRWLRDLLWDYTAARLRSPQAPRSRGSYHNARQACVTLGGFLEARAPAGGDQPGLLSDEHAHAFAADLRHRASNGLPALGISRADGKPSIVSGRSRSTVLNYARKILRHALDTGGADRIGLDRGFIVALPHGGTMLQRTRRPFTDEIARALADPGNLAQLAGTFDPFDRGIRDIWETIIATGRRSSEVISLRLDCAGRYGGLPLLWHDQTKVGNYDEAIRIPEYIYQRITERQRKTLDRFEHHHGRPPGLRRTRPAGPVPLPRPQPARHPGDQLPHLPEQVPPVGRPARPGRQLRRPPGPPHPGHPAAGPRRRAAPHPPLPRPRLDPDDRALRQSRGQRDRGHPAAHLGHRTRRPKPRRTAVSPGGPDGPAAG
jgi:hypothetical protein